MLIAVVVALFLVAAFALDATGGDDRAGGPLPNPMGGPAEEAPGTSSGSLEVGGLEVADSVVEMGVVGLGVTYVPGWDVVNPTTEDLVVTVGQPQVLEGCCPGPVYVDGDLVDVGATVTVPAGAQVLLEFPLQMHPGMDGWHDLAVPLEVAGEQAAVRVTGDFSPEAAV